MSQSDRRQKMNSIENIEFPKVSIVVAIGNMNGNLKNLITWTRKALQRNYQVLYILNGITDDTESRLRIFESKNKHSGLQILESQKMGPGHARNYGLKKAFGEFVIFWDSDDLGDINEVENAVNRISNNSDLVVCDFRHINISKSESIVHNTSKLENPLFQLGMNPGIWRIIFRRDFIRKCKFGSSKMGEDQVFLVSCLRLKPKIEFLNHIIYNYYSGSENQLTYNNDNLKYLLISIGEIQRMINSIPTKYESSAIQILTRMSLTLMIHAKYDVRKKFIFKTVKFIFKRNHNKIIIREIILSLLLFLKIVKESRH